MHGTHRRRWIALAALVAWSGAASRAGDEEEKPKPAKEVKLQTEDGLVLAADLYEPAKGGEGRPAVVALHAEGGDRSMWKETGALFQDHGTSLLAIDVRGHGGSKVQKGPTPSPDDAGTDLSPKIAARDAETFAAIWKDAAAGVKYLRATLLADGSKIAVVGAGACGGAGLEAASRDAKVAAALWIAPAVNNFGVAAMEAIRKWDGRPVGLMTTWKSGRTDFDNVLRALAKQPRVETIVLSGPAAAAGEVVAKGDGGPAEVVQFVLGWMLRPQLDGKSDIEDRSASGKIVMQQNKSGFGMAGGGALCASGSEAPPQMDGLCVMACGEPSATKLPEGARRLSFRPGPKGKAPALDVTIEEWRGSWKQVESRTLLDHGAILLGKEFNTYEVLLTPRLLGVRPFSGVAVICVPIVKGKPKFGNPKKKPDFGETVYDTENPSSWGRWSLR